METLTAFQLSEYEQVITRIMRALPPDRVAELVDFARFLELQTSKRGDEIHANEDDREAAREARGNYHAGPRAVTATTDLLDGEPYQYYPLGQYVVRALGVCGGRPTFKYTRIEITGTLERLAAGESMDAIVAGYRGRVSREAITEAMCGLLRLARLARQ